MSALNMIDTVILFTSNKTQPLEIIGVLAWNLN